MKPTSVIFLIVSVLLACVGVLLCITASSLATEQGIGLFTQTGDADDNYVTTETFTEEDLRKIVVKASDVSVNVIGGAEESKIELVNFLNNSYSIQSGRSTLHISDNAGITGFIDLENFKINFNGFRDYLHYISDFLSGNDKKEKVINIYLTDEADLVNFNITVGDGDITVSNVSTDCDYRILLDNGVVDIGGVTTGSSIQIESTESSNIKINATAADELHITSPKSECFIEITDFTFTRAMYIEAKSGDILYDRVESDFAGLDVRLSAEGNTVTVFGEIYPNEFVELNASTDGTETEPPADDETEPNDPDAVPGDDETTEGGEETEAPEDIGNIDDEQTNSGLTIPANSITIIIADGNIEVK
ncbi:MAG: hypothetical protein ACI3XI_09180 [Eubacteriales bacterium]